MTITTIPYRFSSLENRDRFIQIIQKKDFNILNINEQSFATKMKASDSWIPGQVNVKVTETKTIYTVMVGKELKEGEKNIVDNLVWYLNAKDPWRIGFETFFMTLIGVILSIFILNFTFQKLLANAYAQVNFQPITNTYVPPQANSSGPSGEVMVFIMFILFFCVPLFFSIKAGRKQSILLEKIRFKVEEYF